MLLMSPNILIHSNQYSEIPKQPWNHMLDSVNTVNLAATISQPAQPQEPEARVYGPKSKVWTYEL